MGEGSLQLCLAQKKYTTKSKIPKPATVSEMDMAQFPNVLSDLGGNAENQVNS